jgi:hypothetical protein
MSNGGLQVAVRVVSSDGWVCLAEQVNDGSEGRDRIRRDEDEVASTREDLRDAGSRRRCLELNRMIQGRRTGETGE